jgi:exonuclease VII small subunit
LRESGYQSRLPRGLIARAELFRVCGELERAKLDLDEAMAIAKRGGMGLHQADCHLEYARLYLARGEREKARESFSIAKEMIKGMEYHRRDTEVQDLENQL